MQLIATESVLYLISLETTLLFNLPESAMLFATTVKDLYFIATKPVMLRRRPSCP